MLCLHLFLGRWRLRVGDEVNKALLEHVGSLLFFWLKLFLLLLLYMLALLVILIVVHFIIMTHETIYCMPFMVCPMSVEKDVSAVLGHFKKRMGVNLTGFWSNTSDDFLVDCVNSIPL